MTRRQRGIYRYVFPTILRRIYEHPIRLAGNRVLGMPWPGRQCVIRSRLCPRQPLAGPRRIAWHRPTARVPSAALRAPVAGINRSAWAWPYNAWRRPWRCDDDRMAGARSWPHSRRVRRQHDGVGRPVGADAVAGVNIPLDTRQRIVRISAAHPLDVQIPAHDVNSGHHNSPCVDVQTRGEPSGLRVIAIFAHIAQSRSCRIR